MKNIIILALSLLLFGKLHAQNDITFYRFSQAGIELFHDAFIVNNGERYYLIGEENVGMSISYMSFVLTEYDSLGMLLNKYDLSYVYNHGYSFQDGYGEAQFLSNGDLFLDYEVSLQPPRHTLSCLLNNNRNVIWRDSLILRVQSLGNNFMGIGFNEKKSRFKKVDSQGNKIWEISFSEIFQGKEINFDSYSFLDSLISVIAFGGRTDSTVTYYEAFVTYEGEFVSLDSFVFNRNNGYSRDIYRFPNGYVISNNYYMDYIYISDNNKNIIWKKIFSSDSNYVLRNCWLDNNLNYCLLIQNKNNKNDTSSVYEFFKISRSGELLSHQFIAFKYNTNIINVKQLDNGYFLIGVNYFIKTDSNFKIKKTVSIDQSPKKQGDISIFPNPLTATATINLPIQPKQNTVFRLYSLTGRLIKEETITGNSYLFYRNNLPEGMYIYSITGNAQRFVGKLMIE